MIGFYWGGPGLTRDQIRYGAAMFARTRLYGVTLGQFFVGIAYVARPGKEETL